MRIHRREEVSLTVDEVKALYEMANANPEAMFCLIRPRMWDLQHVLNQVPLGTLYTWGNTWGSFTMESHVPWPLGTGTVQEWFQRVDPHGLGGGSGDVARRLRAAFSVAAVVELDIWGRGPDRCCVVKGAEDRFRSPEAQARHTHGIFLVRMDEARARWGRSTARGEIERRATEHVHRVVDALDTLVKGPQILEIGMDLGRNLAPWLEEGGRVSLEDLLDKGSDLYLELPWGGSPCAWGPAPDREVKKVVRLLFEGEKISVLPDSEDTGGRAMPLVQPHGHGDEENEAG